MATQTKLATVFEIEKKKHHMDLECENISQMIYNHTMEGGTLVVDGVEDVSYRTHYMGPCGSFNSLVFGGLSKKVYGTTVNNLKLFSIYEYDDECHMNVT